MDPSETLVVPKTEVDSNTEVLPKTELDTDTDESYRNIREMLLNNTDSYLIQPKLEFPSQDESDHTLTPKLEPDLEVPPPLEPLSEIKSEPNPDSYVEPKSESIPAEETLHTPALVEPSSVTLDEESNTSYATSEDSEDLPNLSIDGEETSALDLDLHIPEAIESTSATLVTEAVLSPVVTIDHELPSSPAAEASSANLIEEVVDVESGWPPQVVDLTEEEGINDTDIVEVLEVAQNVIYDGSVSRREERSRERSRRRKRKRERREQRASNTNVSHTNETIEINDELDIEDIDDLELDVENVGASTSRVRGANNYGYDSPVTVDIEAFTIPDSPPDSTPQDRLSPPPLRQAHLTNNDIPFMNNPVQNHDIIDFQDPNLLFGSLLASPVLEHVDDGMPFLRPNSPDVFPMAQVGDQHPDIVMRPLSPELFPMIPMERPPRPVRRTRMATRNAAAAAAADRSRSRSPLGDGGAEAAVDFADAVAATAANYAEFERLLNPPAAGPPIMLMGIPDFPHSSNMDIQHMQRPSQAPHIPDLQHLHMHRPSQSQPFPPLQHQPASTSAPVPPPRQPSPPPRAGSLSCPICLDTLGSIQAQRRNLVSTVCGHIFCSHCLEESLKARKECPTCRKKLTKKQYHPIYI